MSLSHFVYISKEKTSKLIIKRLDFLFLRFDFIFLKLDFNFLRVDLFLR